MTIYPAIDIRMGKCVRLRQGDFGFQTIYGDPIEMAERFIEQGAKWIHVVDLDGAKSGTSRNLEIIKKLALMDIKVQLGGGLRTLEDIEDRLSLGVSRCVIGSIAVLEPRIVEVAAFRFTGMVVVGIDAKDGRVAIKGWKEAVEISPVELALRMKGYNIKTIIYTDITRDGMKVGPNVQATRDLAVTTAMDVIASGGVGSIGDVKNVREAGLAGVIIGKAIYDGDVDLGEALRVSEGNI